MDLEENNKKLAEIMDKLEENNLLLKKIRRNQITAKWSKIIYFLIIIFLTLITYYYLSPYINTLTKTFKNVQNLSGSFENLKSNADNINNNINNINKNLDISNVKELLNKIGN